MKNGLKAIGREFSQLILGIGKGIGYVFITIPKKIFGLDKNKEEVNKNPNEIDKGKKSLRQSLNDWYDNLPAVKAKREKEEASLVPFVLDKEKHSIKSDKKHMYKYKVRNAEGKIVEGFFPAFSVMDVYSYLTDEKMTVYKIETNKSMDFLHGESSAMKTKMKTKDLVFWLTQLSTYIKAGIPLTDSVKVLAQQDKRKKYKGLYESIIYELTMGETFSDALAKQDGAFPGLLVNMIKSAEMTGSIEETLDEMSDYYQDIEETKRAIVSAMAYPAIVLIFAFIVVIFMLTYIVPKFVDVYASMGSEIPKITQITLKISDFLQTQYLYIILIVLVIVVVYIFLFKKVKAFRTAMQTLFMKLPIVGNLIISKEMSMFARTFSSLQKNNVLLTDSIDILAKITSNEIYKELELRTIDNLIKGNKMSETFQNHWAIPDVAYFMIVTGESTGDLAEMLEKVADFYSKQEKNAVAMIKTFIEPAMIVFLAVVVGFILVSVVVPMFGIYQTVA